MHETRNRELENLTAENATLKEHLHEVTKALLVAIEEIRGWHGQSHWKLYYETWETMKPVREVLERPDSVGTYSAEEDDRDE